MYANHQLHRVMYTSVAVPTAVVVCPKTDRHFRLSAIWQAFEAHGAATLGQ